MSSAKNLESTIGGWYKNVPHLPKNGQQWLADNVWWLALIGAVVSVIGLLAVIPLFFVAMSLSTVAGTYSSTYMTGYAAATSVSWLGILIVIVSYVFTTILLLMSINPLKLKKPRGWTLLFWSYLVTFALNIVGDIISMSIVSIIGAIIGAGITGYFLYEIRSHFVAKHTVHHKKAAAK